MMELYYWLFRWQIRAQRERLSAGKAPFGWQWKVYATYCFLISAVKHYRRRNRSEAGRQVMNSIRAAAGR